MNGRIPIKIPPQEMKDFSLKLNYNIATDFKDVIEITICGKTYVIYDQYCKIPDCNCTESSINFVELIDNQLSDTILLIDYDYEKKAVLQTTDVLPADFEMELISKDSFNVLLKYRHLRVKLAFAENELKSEKGRVKSLISSKRLISRNDPCVCGSGRKYKNCCGK
jgi:SEC-C motif